MSTSCISSVAGQRHSAPSQAGCRVYRCQVWLCAAPSATRCPLRTYMAAMSPGDRKFTSTFSRAEIRPLLTISWLNTIGRSSMTVTSAIWSVSAVAAPISSALCFYPFLEWNMMREDRQNEYGRDIFHGIQCLLIALNIRLRTCDFQRIPAVPTINFSGTKPKIARVFRVDYVVSGCEAVIFCKDITFIGLSLINAAESCHF